MSSRAALRALGLLMCAAHAAAQTLPSGELFAPPLVVGDDEWIGSDTTLTVSEGGVVGEGFDAGQSQSGSSNVVVNISGGSIGRDFNANGGATVNLSGGNISRDARIRNGATLNVTGGYVGSGLRLYSGSETNLSAGTLNTLTQYGGELAATGGAIASYSYFWGGVTNLDGATVGRSPSLGGSVVFNLSDGFVGEYGHASSGSTLIVSGGVLGRQFDAFTGSTVRVSGGLIHGGFDLRGAVAQFTGGIFEDGTDALSGCQLTISGSDFRLDGQVIAGLETPGASLAFDVPEGAVLSGTFANGTPFAFSSSEGDDFAPGVLTLDASTAPPPSVTMFNVPNDPAPAGVRDGQTLYLTESGVLPSSFSAGWGSTVNVDGGEVGSNLEAAGAEINLGAGSIGWAFDAFHGSVVNISGGRLDHSARIAGGVLNVTGGSVGRFLRVDTGGAARFSGGTLEDRLTVDSGATFTLAGGGFRVDGTPIAGLANVGDSLSFDLAAGSTLSGTLADGTPFALSSEDQDNISPGTLTLEAAAVASVGPAELDAAVDEIGLGVRDGQTLTVGAGAVVPQGYNAGRGSFVNVSGGNIGDYFEAVAAEVNLSSGEIGAGFDAYDGAVVNMTGGSMGSLAKFVGGVLNLSGGEVESVSASAGGVVNVVGGKVVYDIFSYNGAMINLLSGSVNRIWGDGGDLLLDGANVLAKTAVESGATLRIQGGAFANGLNSLSGATVVVAGVDFAIDGVAVAGLHSPGETLSVDVPQGAVLSGTLADGTPFVIGPSLFNSDRLASGTLTLELSERPSVGPAVVTVPGDAAPLGVRDGQRLVLGEGGQLPANFNAGAGSVVEIHGGQIGPNLEAVGAGITMTGGVLGADADLFAGSSLTMTGGVISDNGSSASAFHVTGGEFNLHGGVIEPALIANGGAVNIFGYGFAIDGTPIEGLAPDEPLAITERGPTLTGYLSDGTPFSFTLRSTSGRIFDAFSPETLLTVSLSEANILPGDYNNDGMVDAADYTVWRDLLGGSTPLANETVTLGSVTAEDLQAWRDNYGAVFTPAPPSMPIPSPDAGALLLVLLASSAKRRLS